MNNRQLKVTILLISIFLGASFLFADYSRDSIYYFTKFGGDSIQILEIWSSKVDVDEIKNLGYDLVTYDNLHDAGYLVPSESEDEARDNGDIDEGNEDGYGYSSWINATTENGTKKIQAGSSTSRPWYAPGALWLTCSLYVRNVVGGPFVFSGAYAPYSTWGYRTYKSFLRTYSNVYTKTWLQKGRHHWGNPLNPTSSQISKNY